MNDSDKIILVVLGRSIQSEEAGNDFYGQMVAVTKDPVSKELFKRLALEEENHEKDMRDKYDEIAQRCGWEPYEGAATYKFLDHLDVDLPFLSQDSPTFNGNENLDERDALHLAVRIEKASTDFFLEAALVADQTDVKEFFIDLAKSEASHSRILEKELLRLANVR